MGPTEARLSTTKVLSEVRQAWIDGRPIIPIVGAGLSVHTGFPILNSICRYLARFLYALEHDLLLPKFDDGTPDIKLNKQLSDLMNRARQQPIHYLDKFGWPDRFDLTERVGHDVLAKQNHLDQALWTNHELIEEAITSRFSRLAKESCPRRAANHWQQLNQPQDKDDTGARTPASAAWDRWTVQGDWRRLIQFFVSHRADYADALFARFGFQRNPGQGHRYMSLLCRLLSIRRVFTFNFDDLIEKSLTMEGIPNRIYGMEHGRTLPSPRVLDDELSIIKMHGSHHSILVDEQLDRPLDASYIDRFYDLAGRNALLLVLGCSGDDRRLEDILAARDDMRHSRSAQVCWVYFERTSPVSPRMRYGDPLCSEERQGQMKATLSECPTNNPAAFLRHLVFFLTERFPASKQFYASHPSVPSTFSKPSTAALDPLRKDKNWRYSYKSKLDVVSAEHLLDLATACANEGFVVIWVDVEAVHTLAGLVGVIIDGCRRVDPDLPPAVMPLNDNAKDSRDSALARLQHALRRHRYAVIIDAVGNYGSSPLMHHSSSRIGEGGDVKWALLS
jgi:hypothetical protein